MRRIFLPHPVLGDQPLPPDQAHYLRDVLRLGAGDSIEVFDRSGNHGIGALVAVEPAGVILRMTQLQAARQSTRLTVAAAIPKGARADWMIEKLSELGTDIFIPLAAERSVVLPEGKSKLDRWNRIAEESARQSGRTTVMQIQPLQELKAILSRQCGANEQTWYLSTHADAQPIAAWRAPIPQFLTLLIGPEGGWTSAEETAFAEAGLPGMLLTRTILRIETAAVAAAAIVQSILTANLATAKIDS